MYRTVEKAAYVMCEGGKSVLFSEFEAFPGQGAYLMRNSMYLS